MRRTRRQWGRSGQVSVEAALALPILLVLLCGAIDAGRLSYTLAVLKANAEATARQVALFPNRTSDCSAWRTAETSPGLIKFVPDPLALDGQASYAPTAAASVPSNTAYIYIYPAVSTATPQDSGTNCNAALTGRPKGSRVQVRITYHFSAWTPIPAPFDSVFLTADASALSEY